MIKRYIDWNRDRCAFGDDGKIREPASKGSYRYSLADSARIDSDPNGIDHPRKFRPGHVGERRSNLILSSGNQKVDETDTSCSNGNPHLTRTR
jgi:hypothetical protein